jgi:nucleotide-binding universal stress UspA family protein
MIVVGVDGSKSARGALAWALAEARLRGDVVRVVSAWCLSPSWYGGIGLALLVPEDSFRRAAEQAVDESLAALADDADGVRVERVILEGTAAEVLLEATKDADLLVVGSRGHGTLAGMLLGSVSQQVAHYASCPVVIFHDTAAAAAEAA